MLKNNNIHYFSSTTNLDYEINHDKIGVRGKRLVELANLKMPILPGIIIDSDIASKLMSLDINEDLKKFCDLVEIETGKKFGDEKNPAILKIVISPSLEIEHFPSIHTVGLTDKTIQGFKEIVGENFAYHEYSNFLIKGMLNIIKLKYGENNGFEKIEKFMKQIDASKTLDDYKKNIEFAKTLFPKEFFQDAFFQLNFILESVSVFLNSEEMDDEDTAIIVQPMVYGNYGKDSYSGSYYTRNIVTGEQKIQGICYQDKFDAVAGEEIDIHKIENRYITELNNIADQIETNFKEIREIIFTIEKGKLWLIGNRPVVNKSTQADLKCLFYLLKKKIIDDKYIIKNIKPSQVSEILHPIIDPSFVQKLKCIEGGIAGAPGAATGKIYFSTEALIEAKRKAAMLEQDLNVILCLPATYAEDVKAIEVANAVLSSEGGYSAHASVVARQYGKVSLVNPDLKINVKERCFEFGDITIREGDYITLDVPYYGKPKILLGKTKLIEPDPKESGLLDLIKLTENYVKYFKVYGNADTPKDAAIVKLFGGEGIGLCRTEHMFFDEKKINIFREMIMANNPDERKKALDKLQNFQRDDFYGIFKAMYPFPVTIRLLDAPLHEFLPHTDEEFSEFMSYLKQNNQNIKVEEVKYKFDSISEVNPMLGHRGCRIAVTYPEIYEMQVKAIFEAAYALQSEGIEVKPEIMIPIVMNAEEVKLIRFGKKIEGKYIKGIKQIEEETREKLEPKKALDFLVGTMIELPSAALSADTIARYSEFFSFGTNDLTQTTHGLSRDDFNSFMPDYSLFDLIDSNPFKVLTDPVKEMISIATTRGRLVRPDIKIGLCGEQGAEPENIEFLKKIGLKLSQNVAM